MFLLDRPIYDATLAREIFQLALLHIPVIWFSNVNVCQIWLLMVSDIHFFLHHIHLILHLHFD